jgi:hypothetical protein
MSRLASVSTGSAADPARAFVATDCSDAREQVIATTTSKRTTVRPRKVWFSDIGDIELPIAPPLRRKVASTQDKAILATPLKRGKKGPNVGCLASGPLVSRVGRGPLAPRVVE